MTAHPKQSRTTAARDRHWIVVADHCKANLYEKTRKGLEPMSAANTAACCSRDFPAQGKGREDVFLRELAAWLNQAENEAAFDRLLIIAPPAAADEIRALLGEGEATRVSDELDRQIVSAADAATEDRLTETVWH